MVRVDVKYNWRGLDLGYEKPFFVFQIENIALFLSAICLHSHF